MAEKECMARPMSDAGVAQVVLREKELSDHAESAIAGERRPDRVE